MLDRAARAAVRGIGDAEPNPPVGCVIARPTAGRAEILGIGHHRAFGMAHAEIEALEACARASRDPAGATAWVTLEPCAHHGKTPPCAEALIDAGIAEVVFARPDPHPDATGGADRLRAAGVIVRESSASVEAVRLTDAFITRLRTGLPWVIVKWAQTIDGRVADRAGASRWISGARSRLDVHRLRARVDAILTGIGTASADDPALTARGLRRVRLNARRIVVDPRLEMNPAALLVRTARDAPTMLWCEERAVLDARDRAVALESAGVEIRPLPARDGRLDLAVGLRRLARDHGAARVLVEAGPGLVGDLAARGLIHEIRAYVAPALLGDARAAPAVGGEEPRPLAGAERFRLVRMRRFGDDALLIWRRPTPVQ